MSEIEPSSSRAMTASLIPSRIASNRVRSAARVATVAWMLSAMRLSDPARPLTLVAAHDRDAPPASGVDGARRGRHGASAAHELAQGQGHVMGCQGAHRDRDSQTDEPGQEQQHAQPGYRGVDLGQGPRGAHHGATGRKLDRYGDVEQVVFHRMAVAPRYAASGRERFDDLGPVRVILQPGHIGRGDLGVAKHSPVRSDHGNAIVERASQPRGELVYRGHRSSAGQVHHVARGDRVPVQLGLDPMLELGAQLTLQVQATSGPHAADEGHRDGEELAAYADLHASPSSSFGRSRNR